MTWKKWISAITRDPMGDGFTRLAGYPVADVVKRLGVSEQRVRQLVEAGQLDAIQITTAKGTVAVTLITEASLEAYEPRPAGRPVQLAFPE
jgi:hypothetical protein